MRIVFMGTSSFAVPSLEQLLAAGHEVAAVVTQPDRPSGRGRKLKLSPVKEKALYYHLPCYQPLKIKDDQAFHYIKDCSPELIVVVAYGQILPGAILDYPPYGSINVHASLLPRYRGAAPVQRAIMAGEKVTGVTTMFMDRGLDTGDIIMQAQVEIEPDMDHGQLESILAEKGARLLIDTIHALQEGSISRIPQDHRLATIAARITSEDEYLDFTQAADVLHNRIRAMNPAPGAYSYLGKSKIKVWRSRVEDSQADTLPGQIAVVDNEGFIVQTGKGSLRILEIQKEGKKRIGAADFARGHRLQPGAWLGPGEV